MNSKCENDEIKKYEHEFSEFLIEKIKQADGSLQFHHLSGLLQQAPFDIRDAFGTTKGELMKFLRAHPKIFKIDSKSIVTVVSSYVSDDDSYDDNKSSNSTERQKPILTKIENGIGFIKKLFTEFGVIKAIEPIKTYVHFTPPAYTANKDSLFIDCDLQIETEVYFNAVYGVSDSELEYCATKVWQKLDVDNKNSDIKRHKNSKTVAGHLDGEGIIQKIFPNLGFIEIFGKENETVFFHKNSVKDCNNIDLTKLFKVRDCVEFSASRSDKEDSKAQWKAETVRKKSKKDCNQSYSNSGTNVININIVKKKIENEHGRIFPHSHGAVIKFGKDYSELADGDSSDYFLYGAEVSDIAWEFSEGDDVQFDALRTKSASGWKAVLVWVGEKPIYINDKKISSEEINVFPEDKSCSSTSDVSSAGSRTKKSKSSGFTTEHVIKRQNKSFDHSVDRKVIESDGEYKKQNLKSFKIHPQTHSLRKPKNRKAKDKPEIENSHVNKYEGARYKTSREQNKINESERKNSPLNKHKGARCRLNRKLDETPSLADKDYEGHLSSEDDLSDISQVNSEGDIEVQNILNNGKYLEKEKQYDESCLSTLNFEVTGFSEDDIENKNNEKKCHKSNGKIKPSIKKFEDIDGNIIFLYCKAAIVKSSHLQKDVDFVLNAFYLDGKSVEEQQVIDLKEIIKVGDCIKFNCFEIIDDLGEIHQKVTMAWKGPRPKVYEMTPEEFIMEYELSVSVKDELDSDCIQEHKITPENFLTTVSNSDETLEIISNTKSSSSNDVSDDELFRHSKKSKTGICKELEEQNELSSDVHYKLLSEMIIERLRSKGFIFSDSKANFSNVLTEVIHLVLKYCSANRRHSSSLSETVEESSKYISQSLCFTCAEKESKTFSSKNKIAKHAEVQTIITGGIVAQSIYTQN